MAKGGYRPGAGRPKGSPNKPKATDQQPTPAPAPQVGSPLEYMISVMNDLAADDARRDRMAIAAAPYVHGKAADAAPGKKEQKQARAEEAAGGKFAPRARPKLAVNNG